MNKKIRKLGEIVLDTVTGIKGMLIVLNIDFGKNELYLFQPYALNPEDSEPVLPFWLTSNRIEIGQFCEVELPIHILGTHVEDKGTGFNGTAICLDYHLNGCIHIEVKPRGVIEKTGKSINTHRFDIRRLKGDAIVQMTEQDLEKSKTEKPSPEVRPNTTYR